MGQTNEEDLLHALHERIAVLEHELAAIRTQTAALPAAPPPPTTVPASTLRETSATEPIASADPPVEPIDGRSDRRQLLRRVGTVAAGAVAGGAALAVSQASPAAAADGDALKIGLQNSGSAITQLDGSQMKVTNDATAIIGQTSGASGAVRGVHGFATGGGVGVLATSADGAPLHISNGTQVIPPQAGTWAVGQFLIAGSHLFYCYFGGPGPQSKWARVSATFVPLAAPARVYDSRPGATPLGVVKGKLADHAERVVDPKLGGAVPSGASAVVMNLTATDTNPGGFLSAFKNGVAWPGTS